jgi:hypothetical protein
MTLSRIVFIVLVSWICILLVMLPFAISVCRIETLGDFTNASTGEHVGVLQNKKCVNLFEYMIHGI